MSTVTGPVLLSEIASLATRAHDRAEFRTGTLALLESAIRHHVAFFLSSGNGGGTDPVSRGLAPLAERLLARRAVTVWSELSSIRAAASGGNGVLDASGLVGDDSELGRLLRTDRPVRHLCGAVVDEGRTVLILGRADEPFQRRELELLRLCLPV